MEQALTERKRSLLESMSAKFELEPAKFLQTVKATIFDARASEEELIAFLVVCNRYELDPFRKEIYAFRQGDKVVPIVGVDGWCSIVNRNEHFDGCEFSDAFNAQGELVSTTCKVYRKDRSHPITVTEYLRECKRNTPPWNTMPARMLRHRSYIQANRIAFGISGIMDPDEFEQMVETQAKVLPLKPPPATLADLTKQIKAEPPAGGSSQSSPPSNPADSTTPVASEPTTQSGAAAVSVKRTRKVKPPETVEAEPPADENPFLEDAPAPAAPVVKTFHDEVDALRLFIPQQLLYDVIKKHGGERGTFNFGLGLDAQKGLLAELREKAK